VSAARFDPLDFRAAYGTMFVMNPPRRRTPSESRRRALHRAFPDPAERPRFLATRLLRAGEVAALLQVSRRSVASWASRGMIPFIETPGGHRRFRAADVRALVASLERSLHGDRASTEAAPSS
jgi:excisionase family DNA binding protein